MGDPSFGKVLPCSCRAEQVMEQRSERLRRHSQLGPLERLTFDLLLPDGRRGQPGGHSRFREAMEQAQRFAESPEGWLVLVGPSGSGKTHLAAAIANERLSRSEPAIFSVVPDLLDHLRLTFSPSSDISYDELFESIRGTPLLILDDLGTQSSTPWAQEKLFQLLNHRYNARLPTVVTTNHRLEELDERLRARLSDPLLSQVWLVEDWDPGLLQELGGLSLDRFREMTFRSFDPMGIDGQPNESLRVALRAARDYAETLDGWMVLVGQPGTGKTHLAVAIAHELQRRGVRACFLTVPDLLDYLRAAYAPDSSLRYDRVFEALRTAPALVLDDLGAQSSTPWAQEKLFQLFNYRYNARLPTVITTNLQLEAHEARLRSRMLDHTLCNVVGLDAPPYRLQESPRGPTRPRPGRPRRSH